MERFFGYARVLATGAPAPFATITVYDAGTLNISTIYSDDLLTPKANPFPADSSGYLFFYAGNSRYDVNLTNPAGVAAGDPPIPVPYTWGDVVLNDVFTINGLTPNAQFLVTGTAGTDFAIVDAVATHTFNLPDAGAAARGVVTTGAQTFAGAKTFSTPIAINSGGTALSTVPTNGQLLIGNGTNYTLATLTGTANRVTVTNGAGSITLSGPQDLAAASSPSFTGLTLTGLGAVTSTTTIVGKSGANALQSVAATANGQLLIGDVAGQWTRATLTAGTNITITNAAGSITIAGSGGISSLNGLTGATQTFAVGSTGASFNISSVGTTHTFNLPNAGTAADGVVTSGNQTFGGQKDFDRPIRFAATAGATTTQVVAQGALHVTATPVTNTAGSVETDLFTFATGTGPLSVTDSVIHMQVVGTSANNGHTKTIKVYGGATSVSFTLSTGSVQPWKVDAWFLQQNPGGPTCNMIVFFQHRAIISVPLTAVPAITSATLKVTGTASGAADITCYGGSADWKGN